MGTNYLPIPGTPNAPMPSPQDFESHSDGKPWEAPELTQEAPELTQEAFQAAKRRLQEQGGGYLWQPWYFIFRAPDTLDSKNPSHRKMLAAYRKMQSEPDLETYPLGWVPVYIPGSAEAMMMIADSIVRDHEAKSAWERAQVAKASGKRVMLSLQEQIDQAVREEFRGK